MRDSTFTQSILEMAPNGIYEIDAAGTIIYSNPAHHRLLGYEPGSLIGRSILDLIPDVEAERLRADLALLCEVQPEPQPYLNKSYTRDGREIVVEVHWTYKRDDLGAVVGFIAILNDVTARQEAERLREEARRTAEEAAQSRSRFLAAASHDLRQPLQALALFVSRLERRELDPVAREVVGDIRESVATLSTLLNSLLDMSRFDAGMTRAACLPVPLAEVLDGIQHHFQLLAQRNGLILRVRQSALVVRSDPHLLRRVITNLVINAVTYTRTGGVLVGVRRRGTEAVVEVWDTGPGIPDDKLDLIFQEFYQVGNAARERSEGLGLGLAIVDRACRALGHKVTVHSRPGRGSVFRVTLPLAVGEDGETAPHPAATPQDGALVALDAAVAVVDDDPPVRRAMVSLLRDWNCRVIAAADGPQLVAALGEANLRPDVIVADLRLPGDLDGPATIAAVRAEFGAGIPGLVVTGDTDPLRLRGAVSAGHPILHKPVDVVAFHQALARLLGREG